MFAVSNFAKARQALHTSTPGSIFCRDKELAVIEDFMRPLIENKKSGSMYISGRPGTGKTACVTHILSNGTVRFFFLWLNFIPTAELTEFFNIVYWEIQVHFHQLYVTAHPCLDIPAHCPAIGS